MGILWNVVRFEKSWCKAHSAFHLIDGGERMEPSTVDLPSLTLDGLNYVKT